jgi:hypothetical protein
VLRGWTAYFRPGVSARAFQYLRMIVWRQVFGWLRRKHLVAGDCAQAPIPVAVETARGLLFVCLRTTGRKVYPSTRPSQTRTVPSSGRSGGADGIGQGVEHSPDPL